jgi:cytoskeleton-associated protein 5
MLEESVTITLTLPSEERPKQGKYTELTMKCLWKMTKILPSLVEQNNINIPDLLLHVHDFLLKTPPSEWKRRSAEKLIPQADMPLRTVKTIIHEIVNILGEKVYDNLNLIQNLQQSHAVNYIQQMIDSGRRKQIGNDIGSASSLAASVPSGSLQGSSLSERSSITIDNRSGSTSINHGPDSSSRLESSRSISSSHHSSVNNSINDLQQTSHSNSSVFNGSRNAMTEAEADALLTVIFKRIGQKDETKQGIADLYEFRKHNAAFDDLIDVHLGKTGNYFQGYIKRGLASLAADDKACTTGWSFF